jgi:hypothetical protein
MALMLPDVRGVAVRVAPAAVGKEDVILKLITHVVLPQLGVPVLNPWFCTPTKRRSVLRLGLKI